MPTLLHPQIISLPEFEDRPVDTCVAYVLLWLVVCSETASIDNNKTLKKYLATLSLQKQTLQELTVLVKQQQDRDLIQVFDILQSELQDDEKMFLLQIAIAVSTDSHAVSTCANHVLRFLADFLSLGEALLMEQFKAATKQNLPQPEDLSSPDCWGDRESFEQLVDSDSSSELSRSQALRILELEENATETEVKLAYRRQVQIHHPDRFESEGDASAEVAERKFLLIQRAYEALKQ
jgi:DnaJ-domain-containing protein 1